MIEQFDPGQAAFAVMVYVLTQNCLPTIQWHANEKRNLK